MTHEQLWQRAVGEFAAVWASGRYDNTGASVAPLPKGHAMTDDTQTTTKPTTDPEAQVSELKRRERSLEMREFRLQKKSEARARQATAQQQAQADAADAPPPLGRHESMTKADATAQAEREWQEQPELHQRYSTRQHFINTRTAELRGWLRVSSD